MNINEKLDEFLTNENSIQEEQSLAMLELGAAKMSGSLPSSRKSYCVVEQTENYFIVKNGGTFEAIPVENASIVAISVIR
jgi:hypothetical protein